MDYRSVFLIAAVACSAVLSAVACSGPPAGSVSFTEGSSESVAGGSREQATDPASPAPAAATPGAGGDAVFKGSAFVAGAAQGAAKGQATHSALPAPANATLDPSGLNCGQATCHLDKFTFGGTVYTDISGSARVAGAEIRVTGPGGEQVGAAFSDADGNFWLDGAAVPAGSKVGVRKDAKVKLMATPLKATDGACNNTTCHGTATMRVYLN